MVVAVAATDHARPIENEGALQESLCYGLKFKREIVDCKIVKQRAHRPRSSLSGGRPWSTHYTVRHGSHIKFPSTCETQCVLKDVVLL